VLHTHPKDQQRPDRQHGETWLHSTRVPRPSLEYPSPEWSRTRYRHHLAL